MFTRNDLELSSIMAGQIAIAMENARLYRRLEEKQKQTEVELKKTEKRLIKTERQAALAGLVKSIAHQIRNPCMSIGGFAQRIIKESRTGTGRPQTVRRGDHRREPASGRDGQKSGFYGRPETQPQPAADKSGDPENREKKCRNYGSRVVQELAPNLPAVLIDPELMETALEEIIKNAHEAGADTVTVRTRALKGQILIEFIDNGPGMSEHDCTAAVDPFFFHPRPEFRSGFWPWSTGSSPNTGGELEVESEPGKGVDIILALPIDSRPVEAKEGPEPARPALI